MGEGVSNKTLPYIIHTCPLSVIPYQRLDIKDCQKTNGTLFYQNCLTFVKNDVDVIKLSNGDYRIYHSFFCEDDGYVEKATVLTPCDKPDYDKNRHKLEYVGCKETPDHTKFYEKCQVKTIGGNNIIYKGIEQTTINITCTPEGKLLQPFSLKPTFDCFLNYHLKNGKLKDSCFGLQDGDLCEYNCDFLYGLSFFGSSQYASCYGDMVLIEPVCKLRPASVVILVSIIIGVVGIFLCVVCFFLHHFQVINLDGLFGSHSSSTE